MPVAIIHLRHMRCLSLNSDTMFDASGAGSDTAGHEERRSPCTHPGRSQKHRKKFTLLRKNSIQNNEASYRRAEERKSFRGHTEKRKGIVTEISEEQRRERIIPASDPNGKLTASLGFSSVKTYRALIC